MGEIRKDNLHESLIEELNELANIDLSGYQEKTDNNLATNSKDLVGAINELFQSANNGKELIANAIGEPLDSSDTFSAMSDDINGLLNTFKVNMMNNGITVESGDKFKTLIDKIASMVEEGEGNKKWVYGESSSVLNARESFTYVSGYVESRPYVDITNLGFIPSTIIYISKSNTSHFGTLQSIKRRTSMDLPEILFVDNTPTSNSNVRAYVFLANDKVFRSDGTIRLPIVVEDATDFMWIAYGVGEEDTTLRDSLADILENKGVDVTEEDDIASLITKVDSISGGLDIISATELPDTGKENQICVITNVNPNGYLLTSTLSDKIESTDGVTIYAGNTTTNNLIESVCIPITSGDLTTNYYFNKVCQGESGLASYIYQNNEWVELTKSFTALLENKLYVNSSYHGKLYTGANLIKYSTTYGIYVGTNGDWGYGSFNNKINFSLYKTIEFRAHLSESGGHTAVFASSKQINTNVFNSTDRLYYSDRYNLTSTSTLYSLDISSWTGEGYLGFEIFGGAYGKAYITDIILY